MPSEFHFIGNVPNYVMWNVRLVHARGDLERIAQQANEHLGDRAYVPDVGVIAGIHGRRTWLRQTLLVLWRMLRLMFVSPTNSTAVHPGQWWIGESDRLEKAVREQQRRSA
jgi:hypothetical protein